MDAFAFIDKTKAEEPQPAYVLAGDERFLKQLDPERITTLVLGSKEDDLARSVYDGDDVTLSTVRDELDTLPFLSPRRLVVVQDADDFVSKYREALERYVAAPSRTGVLVL